MQFVHTIEISRLSSFSTFLINNKFADCSKGTLLHCYYRFTPKTTQWVLFEFVCKNSLSAWDLGHFKLKIRIVLK